MWRAAALPPRQAASATAGSRRSGRGPGLCDAGRVHQSSSPVLRGRAPQHRRKTVGSHELSLKVLPSVSILDPKGVLQKNEKETRTPSEIHTREYSGPQTVSQENVTHGDPTCGKEGLGVSEV